MFKWFICLLPLLFVNDLLKAESANPDTLFHLTAAPAQIDEGAWLNLAYRDGWKYFPGDNMDWADPDFDDSDWHKIKPGGLSITEIPDTLWSGYGWWRFRFTADSTIYNNNWHIFLHTPGAAEIYLDGELIYTAGNFSVDPKKEQIYNVQMELAPPILFKPNGEHVLAIRFSNHRAQTMHRVFGSNAQWFSFNTAIISHKRNEIQAAGIKSSARTSGLSVGVLFLLLILHVFLYYRFAREKGNIYVIILLSLFLVHAFFSFGNTWFTYSGTTRYLILFLFPVLLFQNITLLPVTLSELFNVKRHRYWKYIALAGFPVGAFFSYIQSGLLIAYILAGIFILGACIYLLFIAWKKNVTGISYVGGGFIACILAMITVLLLGEVFNIIGIESIMWMVAVIYLSIPLGLTLYTANNYSNLVEGLEQQVITRTTELKKSLDELQAAQTQLVQQEKLASLGQLTAGIAHEIKNPLNFVNNFSEVSLELIEEAREEVRKTPLSRGAGGVSDGADKIGQPQNSDADSSFANPPLTPLQGGEAGPSPDKALILEILDDIEANLRKIHEHGSRADGIVKSMLMHSRGGDGKMEPTPLNPLIKEYVNLAFHGMRAGKDPINVDIDLQLDENIGEVPLVAEDFSRVILNLCNNAFDAMREKALSPNPSPEGEGRRGEGEYSPKLTVRTKSDNGHITIEIEDNGPGIPDDIKDKILQPFFTTKKGTEGTGLGLSITHDILKAHGGEIGIDSSAQGTKMSISLPFN